MMIHELQRAAVPIRFRPSMVECLRHCGIRDRRVLAAMASVPRIAFLSDQILDSASAAQRLSLPHDQTVLGSYPFAMMLESLQLEPWHRVLEIGTGAGYSAAVLSLLVRNVYSLEPSPDRADSASARLTALGYDGIAVRCAMGEMGWPDYAPYDAILVGASAPTIPPALLEQLAEGGRLVMPIGDAHHQRLVCATMTGEATISTTSMPVAPIPAASWATASAASV